jgi:thioredoxin 1
MSPVQELTGESAGAILDKTPLVLLLFGRPGCPACAAARGSFEAAAGRHPEVVFGRVDTSREKDLAAAFEVDAVPTLAVVRDQVLLLRQSGVLSAAALEEVLAKAVALDMDEVRRDIERESGEESS